ncbi:MAG: NAD-dependent succinate-semialdehyde dehydrogenase [Halobacteriaceae archaeon]
MESVNPATGEVVGEYPSYTAQEVTEAVGRAAAAFEEWSARPLTERRDLLESVADVLEDHRDRYARTMTREMGKPVDQARSEVEKCAWVCRYYAEHAAAHLSTETAPGEADVEASVRYEPLGPVLAVMPWNFPFWQVFRFAAPALAAGNVGLLKHSSNVPGCARAIEDAFEEAGFPPGAFSALLVGADDVEAVLTDDRVAAATLTGSEAAGRAVASTAGEQLKKTVLELGGSDPFVVLDDADVEAAAETGAWARCQNGGQSCIAAKRFVVHEDVYGAFRDRLVEEMRSFEVGDPTDEDTDVGPQASEALVDDLHEQVERTVEAGATVETGGEPLDREGAYYPPTVLTDVPAGTPAATEELFGPVAAVFEVPDEEAAVEAANDTRFGLGASVWTEDRDRGRRVAERIEAGCVFVNELTKSDPRLPFGGVKDSGYGRELSRAGIREFVNRKTVWVA